MTDMNYDDSAENPFLGDNDTSFENYDDFDKKKPLKGLNLVQQYAAAKQKKAAAGERLSRGLELFKNFVLARRGVVGHGCSPVDTAVLELRHNTLEDLQREIRSVGQGASLKAFADAQYVVAGIPLGGALTLPDFQFGAILHVYNPPFFQVGGHVRLTVNFDTGGVVRQSFIDVMFSPKKPEAVIAILAYANDGGKARVARCQGLTISVPAAAAPFNDAAVTPGIPSTRFSLESLNNFDLNVRGI